MNTKTFSPCGGGLNLILGTGMENQIFFLRTPAAIKFFHQILKKTLIKNKNHSPLRWISITHIWSPSLFPRGIIIFQGVLTKSSFSMKFPHLEKIADLMKGGGWVGGCGGLGCVLVRGGGVGWGEGGGVG